MAFESAVGKKVFKLSPLRSAVPPFLAQGDGAGERHPSVVNRVFSLPLFSLSGLQGRMGTQAFYLSSLRIAGKRLCWTDGCTVGPINRVFSQPLVSVQIPREHAVPSCLRNA